MSSSPVQPPRSVGQWIVTVVFGLLSVAFLFRTVQFGYKWLARVVEGDTNFKAMTIWALVYVIVCAAIAAVAHYMPRETETDETEQDAERGA